MDELIIKKTKKKTFKDLRVDKRTSKSKRNLTAFLQMEARFDNDVDGFKEHVKSLKNLAKGKGPAKSPGNYSSNQNVKGRDENMWRNFRVYYVDASGDERYELVWVRAE